MRVNLQCGILEVHGRLERLLATTEDRFHVVHLRMIPLAARPTAHGFELAEHLGREILAAVPIFGIANVDGGQIANPCGDRRGGSCGRGRLAAGDRCARCLIGDTADQRTRGTVARPRFGLGGDGLPGTRGGGDRLVCTAFGLCGRGGQDFERDGLVAQTERLVDALVRIFVVKFA